MTDLLSVPLPWYIVGPLMGLAVAGLYLTANRHLGISGAYVQIVGVARRRSVDPWRLWFLGGTVIGAAVVSLLAGYPQRGLAYGTLGDYLSLPALAVTLFGGGILIGFGARWAGGCTSGHGLTGCATRSRGSMVALVSFMVTAVAVTLALHALTGGDL